MVLIDNYPIHSRYDFVESLDLKAKYYAEHSIRMVSWCSNNIFTIEVAEEKQDKGKEEYDAQEESSE